MKLGPRARLILLVALFFTPMAASLVVYHFFRPEAAANYGELLLPPESISAHVFPSTTGPFTFSSLRGRWVLVASDSGNCDGACARKLASMRQVRLALGRNASRVVRVFVTDDLAPPDAALGAAPDQVVILPHPGVALPPGAVNDRAHIYLVDPLGNVMMRWPSNPEPRRMLQDLERLLKASQVG
jgi:cytochrome oxidase Cu insertion factor (SCO1/SenC/PrrC family)